MVWPHGQRFGAMLIALLALAVAVCGFLRAYVEYEAHRAKSMVAEASRVRLGDTEASVLPLVIRYGGFKWVPEQLPPRAQWVDSEEYDYQKKKLLSDYKYELAIGPFGAAALKAGRLARAMRAARKAVPAALRSVLGMRDWDTGVELSIRNNRVQSVSAVTLVEGRSEWLGDKWEVAEGMPEHDMRPQSYAIGSAILEMGDNGGTMIENFFTPEASEEQVQAAHNFDSACLTSIRGCTGLCDVAPRALEYLKQHPDAASNIIPPKCH